MTTLQSQTDTPDPAENRGYHEDHGTVTGTVLVRLIIPAFVLFGALMKFLGASPAALPHWIQQIVDTSTANELQAENVFLWIIRGLITIEVVAAGIMLFVPRLARIAAGAILTAFLFVLLAEIVFLINTGSTLLAALSGSCGCFGKSVTIPLWAEFVINAVLVTGVILFRPIAKPLGATPKWGLAALLVWLLAGVQFGMTMNFPPEEDRSWERLSPMHWVGRHYEETALFDFVRDMDFAFFGPQPQTWILYRRGCPTCRNLFKEHYSEPTDKVIVAVEVPPDEGLATDGTTEEQIICPSCYFTVLEGDIQWQVGTPTIIEFNAEGIVTEVRNPMLEEFSKTHDDL